MLRVKGMLGDFKGRTLDLLKNKEIALVLVCPGNEPR